MRRKKKGNSESRTEQPHGPPPDERQELGTTEKEGDAITHEWSCQSWTVSLSSGVHVNLFFRCDLRASWVCPRLLGQTAREAHKSVISDPNSKHKNQMEQWKTTKHEEKGTTISINHKIRKEKKHARKKNIEKNTKNHIKKKGNNENLKKTNERNNGEKIGKTSKNQK